MTSMKPRVINKNKKVFFVKLIVYDIYCILYIKYKGFSFVNRHYFKKIIIQNNDRKLPRSTSARLLFGYIVELILTYMIKTKIE